MAARRTARLVLIAAALAPRFFDESERHTGELDIPGAVTGTLGLLGIVYGLSRAGDQQYGWGDQWTVASLAACVGLLALFIYIESRVEHPLLPFRIFGQIHGWWVPEQRPAGT